MVDDGYLVGYEDGSGNFVEVGRFNNTSENVSDPLIIQHSDSGQQMELGPNGFSTQSVSTDDLDVANALVDDIVEEFDTTTSPLTLDSFDIQNKTSNLYIWFDFISADGTVSMKFNNNTTDTYEYLEETASDGSETLQTGTSIELLSGEVVEAGGKVKLNVSGGPEFVSELRASTSSTSDVYRSGNTHAKYGQLRVTGVSLSSVELSGFDEAVGKVIVVD